MIFIATEISLMIVNEDYFQNDAIICKIHNIRRNVNVK